MFNNQSIWKKEQSNYSICISHVLWFHECYKFLIAVCLFLSFPNRAVTAEYCCLIRYILYSYSNIYCNICYRRRSPSVYLTYIYIIKASFPRFNIMFTFAYFEQSSYLFKFEDGSFLSGFVLVWTMNFARLKYCFSEIVDSLVGFSNESSNQQLIQVLQLKMISQARNQRKTFFQQQKRRSSSNFRETF